MKRLRVAIIDTGINHNHDFFIKKGINITGKRILYINGNFIYDEKYDDCNGHGTACASVIVNLFKNIEIYCVKILDEEGKTNLKVLEEALRHLREDTMVDVISLSVSIIDKCDLNVIKNHCDGLYNKGVYIIASLANGYMKSFPAAFQSVIGVHGKVLKTDYSYWFNKNKEIQCIMDNNPIFACGVENNDYILFEKSNSLACAKFTGILCQVLSSQHNTEYNINILEEKAEKNTWNKEDIYISERLPKRMNNMEVDNSILNKIIKIVCDYYEIEDKENIYINLYSVEVGLTNYNVYKLLCRIEDEFNIEIDLFELNRYDFLSVYSLHNIVLKYK